MSRIKIPTRDEVPAESQAALDAIGKSVGFIPNLFRLMALSPPTLAAQSAFQGALSKALSTTLRTKIALTVSQGNNCNYCLTAHAYHALNQLKITADEISLNCDGLANDTKEEAALKFAKRVTELRGHISDFPDLGVTESSY